MFYPRLWKKNQPRTTESELDFWFPFFRGFDTDTEPFEGAWTPAIDVVESKNDYQIKADLPGLTKDKVDVSINDDVLTIKGEKKDEKETTEDGVVRKERSYGSFTRSFQLPQNVDAKSIKASYKNGVLELTVPKTEESKPKQIQVSIN